MAHNFNTHPELSNAQMRFYYWDSPFKQITKDFTAHVEKVHDGDTITVSCDFRDFSFPIRFLGTNAPELNEDGGHESRNWLETLLLNQDIEIEIDPKQRVGKWGRILGNIIFNGLNINEMSIREGWATTFEDRNRGKIEDINKLMADEF